MAKEKIIIFEGVDRSGKSTLKDALNKKTSYKYWVLDRSPISSLVYEKCFNRHNEQYWKNIYFNLATNFDVKVILCINKSEVIQQRLIDTNEKLAKEVSNITYVQNLFKETLQLLSQEYLLVETNDVSKSLEKVLNYIGE